jgi:hypothetical protein
MTLRTSEAPESCSSASSPSRASCAEPVFRLADELGRRTSFDVVRRFTVLRLRALAGLLLALERRRIAHPKAQDYADFQSGTTAEICDWRNWGAQVQNPTVIPLAFRLAI